MIVLSNGVRIFINNTMQKDIYLGISNFGFENDIDNILGIAHLLEHILINFDSSKFIANASTARNFMSFWCKAIDPNLYKEAIKTLVSWFFINKQLKHKFDLKKIHNHIMELENEYYFRNEILHCMDPLTFLAGGDLYNGGRLSMIDNLKKVEQLLVDRMEQITGSNIVIFVKNMSKDILTLFNHTFGSLPSCPNKLVIKTPYYKNINGKVVMMPSPFYTTMIKVKSTLYNLLAILSLYEIYHLIDYEIVGDYLYVVLSFVNEYDYENFLKGNCNINFNITNPLSFNFSDDFFMNMYLSFPCIKDDIFNYLYDVNTNCLEFIKPLEMEIYNSISNGDYIVIYPNFSQTMFNTSDNQKHKLVVMNINHNNNFLDKHNHCNTFINLMRKQTTNNIFIKYDDISLLNYVGLTLAYKSNVKLLKRKEGLNVSHNFSSSDMSTILNSESFIKFTRSKPAAMYQYILLSFFVSGNSIEDILANRESILGDNSKNKILFGKQTKYDITTKSSFVAGIIKGALSRELITTIMWELKKQGLIYSLEFTNLQTKNTFYIFMFTIYPKEVYNYFSKNKNIVAHCLAVSNKGTIEDFSTMKKNIIIKLS
ncbi:Insulin metalloproteinase-like protein [Eptesipox virus]|uniref:Metalloendopeptidase n=1 Tax=Eptesipox virus TaxID=1329402 RepID=A0A220T6B8_9POXV|nr:Insulin metalloproteinase-like protein [Eptesipox virus]ASK51255.1 Insulin metalloproteinase-like protein [Eptesipox virus]